MQSEHKANLLKLADYLDTLTPEYAAAHFKMAYYRAYVKGSGNLKEFNPDQIDQGDIYACGSCACAIGHGPNAGIPIEPEDLLWDDYSQRVFGMSQDEDGTDGIDWDYMFGPSNPNDPWKAAARIREVVNNRG